MQVIETWSEESQTWSTFRSGESFYSEWSNFAEKEERAVGAEAARRRSESGGRKRVAVLPRSQPDCRGLRTSGEQGKRRLK